MERAIAWSQGTFPDSQFAGAAPLAPTVLIARENLFADSLASATAQAALGAPLLLTTGDHLDGRVVLELDRLGATDAVLLGGTAALSDDVVTELEDLGLDTRRIAGASRLETAVELAEAYADEATTAVLARAFPAEGAGDATQAFADTLAGGGLAVQLGAPILLTQSDVLTDATAALLQGSAVEQVLVLGGSGAIASAVLDELDVLGFDVARIAGATRFDTAWRSRSERAASSTRPRPTASPWSTASFRPRGPTHSPRHRAAAATPRRSWWPTPTTSLTRPGATWSRPRFRSPAAP